MFDIKKKMRQEFTYLLRPLLAGFHADVHHVFKLYTHMWAIIQHGELPFILIL